MKIAILSHKDVAGWYAATLMERGYDVTISGGGAIHPLGLKPYLECDSCLLLGDEPDLLEIADYMEMSGKKIWRELSDIPVDQTRNPKKRDITSTIAKEKDITEQKRITGIGISPAPAGQWWVVLEYDNLSAAVESTHDAQSAAEHKVRWVQR
ncbi:MAG TPA: hypothetical protein VKV96_18090 [Roseiarcus sp.]|nr:hypothetical protein [Roseiarcus sp.]